MGEHALWFDHPAEHWNEALPLGNGLLGAMVFGGPLSERIQVNDGRAWSGSPASESAEPRIEPEVAALALAEARAAIKSRDFEGADVALRRIQHRYSQTYLPFAELEFSLRPHGCAGVPAITGYRRTLDLATATHHTEYLFDGHRLSQRSFVSHAAGVLVVDITTDDPGGIDLSMALDSLLQVLGARDLTDSRALLLKMPADVTPSHDDFAEPVTYSDDDSLSMQGAVVLTVTHDGRVQGGLIRAAHRVQFFLATETTFAGIGLAPVGSAADALRAATARVDVARETGADLLHERHVADHSVLYCRTEVVLGPDSTEPVDRRLLAGTRSPLQADPGLAALLFHYGRYLLISSSREGGVPANLQGIWNPLLQPAWSSNYTTNVNLQMNYWLAEVANLPECLPPLFDLIDALMVTGAETARRLYAADGWVAHHNTDIWAYSQPVGLGSHDPKWSFWPMAGAWLVRHLWARLEYGGDLEFARDRAWAPVRGAVEFYLDWLVELDDGSLGTIPSTSPENQFRTAEGTVASSAVSSTNDLVVVAELFGILIDIAARLGRDDDPVVVAAAAALGRLPGPTIGSNGEVQEWAEDFTFPEPHHRHLSHLYFVHPSGWRVDDELAAAVSRSLDGRGDESTGWSLVWKLIMRARLGQADKVSDLLALIFRGMQVDRGPWVGGLYPNLLSAHPPFSIDGNFGFVTGLAECIMQSHAAGIDLLPAIPRELASGSVRGLVARGGVEVDVEWSAHGEGMPALVGVRLTARHPGAEGSYTVRYRGAELEVMVGAGRSVSLGPADFKAQSDATAASQYSAVSP